MVTQVFLSLFIAILIDSYLGQIDLKRAPIQQYHVQEFISIWQRYDPDATGFIPYAELKSLLLDLASSDDA